GPAVDAHHQEVHQGAGGFDVVEHAFAAVAGRSGFPVGVAVFVAVLVVGEDADGDAADVEDARRLQPLPRDAAHHRQPLGLGDGEGASVPLMTEVHGVVVG